MPGACQAEWLDDKLDSFIKGGYEVALISATCAKRHPVNEISHWRIASLSISDYQDELHRIKERGDTVRLRDYFILPLVITLGVLIDILQYLLTKGIGEGRWSWTLPSSIAALLLALRFKPDLVLSTGGPASAHLSGIVVSKLIGIPLVVELQDPLSGGDIGRNAQSRGWLYQVEKLIVNMADKIVYVTKGAADFAATQFQSSKVVCVYPGAKDFAVKRIRDKKKGSDKLRLVHLGSLYATRNFRSIIAAIDMLVASSRLSVNDIELINMGHVASEIREEILQKSYVQILPPVGREEALQFAADCDITLLIQNSDQRSKVTIPYKTYDYLNLGTRLLGLLNSDELTDLLVRFGHVAVPLADIDAIAAHLLELLQHRNEPIRSEVTIDAVTQANNLLSLTPNRA